MTDPGGAPRPATRWRSRSVSTRVLPDPAGAITRAAPDRWPTAASWSGASSARGSPWVAGWRRPDSALQRWTTPTPEGRDGGSGGPPSMNRGVPSARVMSAGPPDGGSAGRGGAGRLPAVPPDRLAGPGVVVVGPDQEVEPLHLELEVGSEIVDPSVEPLGRLEGVRVHAELDHHRPAFEPQPVEDIQHRAGPGQLRTPDGHPRAQAPGTGGLGPKSHDDAPSQL